MTLTIATGTNYTPGAAATATGTIADNDALVTVTATDPSGAEQGQDPIVFTVTRSNYLTGNIIVNLTWSGTATLGTDYTLSSSGGTLSANGLTLTMFNGDTSYTITAKPVDDAIIEPSETVVLTLGSGTGYSPAAPRDRERNDRRQRHRRRLGRRHRRFGRRAGPGSDRLHRDPHRQHLGGDHGQPRAGAARRRSPPTTH